MPVDKAMIAAAARQANEPYLASYEQRLAAEIVAMLPDSPDDARRVLAVVDAMLAVKLPPREPPASEPRPSAPAAPEAA